MQAQQDTTDVLSVTTRAVSNWNDESARADFLSVLSSHLNDLTSPSPLATSLCVLLEGLTPLDPEEAAPVAPSILAIFLHNLKQSLPSTSVIITESEEKSAFMDLLLDIMWIIDAGMDDRLAEIATVIKAEWTAEKEEEANRMKEDDSNPPASTAAPPTAAKADRSDKPPEASKNPVVERSRLVTEKGRANLAELLKILVSTRVLTAPLAIERLEQPLVVLAGLMHQGVLFNKKTTQQRTNLFYKQTKFNLLREESEGYSKVVAELVSHHSLSAAFAWKRIVSLIGFFDLDPHRVLDVILDVMEANIFGNWKWYLELLKVAGWQKYDTDPKGKGKVRDVPMDSSGESRFAGMALDDILRATEDYEPVAGAAPKEKRTTDVPAQLLGFKFSSHAQPDAPPPKKELYFTVAVLIREGFVSLPDLYPHLSPAEDDMKALEEKYKASFSEQVLAVRSSNALANAAPLTDDGPGMRSRPAAVSSAPAAPVAPVAPKKEPPNHKLGLLKALLSVGALRPSLFILTRHPWMVGAWPNLADLLLRIVATSMEPLYTRISFTSRYPVQTASNSQPLRGSIAAAIPRVVVTSWAPEPPRTARDTFVFFYDRWRDWIPMCEVPADLVTFVEPFMRFIGSHAHRDIVLLTKLCRLAKGMLTDEDQDDGQMKRFWQLVLRSYLLPSLCFLRSNAVFAGEVWSVLRLFDITERWGIYSEWKSSYNRSPELRVKRAETERDAKGMLRRMAKDTRGLKQMARDLAKLAHSNPTVVFTVVLDQVQAYENLNKHVVEALRLLTSLSYDVLTYALLEALCNATRQRRKDDGITPASWMQSLSDFIGNLFLSRLNTMDPAPILQFLANEFKANELRDLLVLQELIAKMSAIEPQMHLNDAQVLALCGGKVLRIEAMASTVLGSLSEQPLAFIKPAKRLISSLQSSQLMVPLLVLLAQQRQLSVFLVPESEANLRFLPSLYDDCQRVLFQYIELLSTHLPIEEHVAAMPSLSDLCITYKVDPCIAFLILRPDINQAIKMADAALREKARIEAAEAAEAKLKREAKAAAAAKSESPHPNASGAAAGTDAMDVDPSAETAAGAAADTSASTPRAVDETPKLNGHAADTNGVAEVPSDAPASAVSPWHPALQPHIDVSRNILPASAQNVLGPAFFVTFWQLAAYDIMPPIGRYEQEQNRLKKALNALNDEIRHCDNNLRDLQRQPKTVENIQRTRDFEAQKLAARRKIPRCTEAPAILAEEVKVQIATHQIVKKRLQKEKDHWFSNLSTQERQMLPSQILQHCLFPRAMLSPVDAAFCARFIKVMHTMATKNFATIRMYDRIFSEQTGGIICCCTETEARNYAHFLHDILVDLHVWFTDEQKYEAEALGKAVLLPGFQKKWTVTNTIVQSDMLTHYEFKRAVMKFHNLLRTALQRCLESMEYMQVRNAIVMMNILLPVFPLYPMSRHPGYHPSAPTAHLPGGQMLEERLRSLIAVEHREDIKVLAQGYHARLMARKSLWVWPTVAAAPAAAAARRQDQTAKPGTVQQVNGTTSQAVKGTLQVPRAAAPPVAPKAGSSVPAGTPTGPAAGNAARAQPSNVNSVPAPRPAVAPESTVSAPAQPPIALKSALDSIPKPEVIKRTQRTDARPEGQSVTPPVPATAGQSQKSPATIQPEQHEKTTSSQPDARGASIPTPVAEAVQRPPSGPAPEPLLRPAAPPRKPSELGVVSNGPSSRDGGRPTDVRSLPLLPPAPSQAASREPGPSAQSVRRADIDPARTIRPQVDPAARATPAAMQPPVAPSSTTTSQELRAVAQAASSNRDLPRRPDVEHKPVGNSRAASPVRQAPTSPRIVPGRRRSPSPDPRRGRASRSGSVDSIRASRARADREERERYNRDGRGLDTRDRREPRDHRDEHRGDPRDKYRPNGDYPEDQRREARPHERGPDLRDIRDRETDRPPHPRDARDRERDLDRDREREERDRGKDRSVRDREMDRERGQRDSRRTEPPATGGGEQPLKPREEPPRRPPPDLSRKRARDDEDQGRDPKRRDRHGRRDRDRTPEPEKAADHPKPNDRDRDRDRRRDVHNRREDDYGNMNTVPPVTPGGGAPPTAPRSMNRPSPGQPNRWEQNNEPRRLDAPPHMALPSRPANAPADARGPPRDDRRSRRDGSPAPRGAHSGRSTGTLVDRLGPRTGDGGNEQGHPSSSAEVDRSSDSGRKRTYSDRDADSKDDSDRDGHKRQKRIDRQGVKQREASRSLLGTALKDTHKQDSRESGRSGSSRRGD